MAADEVDVMVQRIAACMWNQRNPQVPWEQAGPMARSLQLHQAVEVIVAAGGEDKLTGAMVIVARDWEKFKTRLLDMDEIEAVLWAISHSRPFISQSPKDASRRILLNRAEKKLRA